MTRRILLLLLSLLAFPFVFAQDADDSNREELIVDGKCSGSNLYVLNPSAGDSFSVQSVTLNGKDYPFTHNTNAFEISLADYSVND